MLSQCFLDNVSFVPLKFPPSMSEIRFNGAEAPCNQAVSTAKNIVSDIGVKASLRSPGLLNLASSSDRNAERDAHRQFSKYKLRLPIDLSKVNGEVEGKKSFQALRLRDWLEFILQRNLWHVLTGLAQPDPKRCERYRQYDPLHPAFQLEAEGKISLARTCAIAFHGDEGRTRKKSQFFVCSWRSLLGKGLQECQKKRRSLGIKNKYLKMKLNYQGHVFTTRYLCGVLPKSQYAKNDSAVRDLLSFAADEQDFVSREGVTDTQGTRFNMMLIGVSGDWPFLAKAGCLERNFACYPKVIGADTGEPVWCRGICHLCEAGKGPYPFENLSSETPEWLDTIGRESPFKELPPFSKNLHTEGELEKLYRFDPWHNFHLGAGKLFMGNALAIASTYFDGSGIDTRFEHLNDHIQAWAKANSEYLHVSAFTKEGINWDTTKDYPNGGWGKGATTAVLLKWFIAWSQTVESEDELFLVTRQAAICANESFALMYSVDDVWLEASVAARAGKLGMDFLKLYCRAARIAYSRSQCLFVLVPKFHCLHHLFLTDLLMESRKSPWVLHPLNWGTQMDEDNIGRTSRISRRVHPTTVVSRVLLRFLTKARQEYVKAGYLQR